jgi:hypothetical protein
MIASILQWPIRVTANLVLRSMYLFYGTRIWLSRALSVQRPNRTLALLRQGIRDTRIF